MILNAFFKKAYFGRMDAKISVSSIILKNKDL